MVTELGIVVFWDEVRGKGLLLTATRRAIHFNRGNLKGYASNVVPTAQWILEATYRLTPGTTDEEYPVQVSIDLPLQVDADAARDVLLDLYFENEEARYKEKFSRIAVQRF